MADTMIPIPPSNRGYKVALLLMALIFIISAGAFSYLYFQSQNIINTHQITIATITAENNNLKTDNASMSADIVQYKEKLAKIALYNDLHQYIYDVIVLHGGFIGLTEDEYQIARTKAEATEDQDLLSAVDSAWNDRNGEPMARFALVMKSIIDGVEGQTE